MDYFPDDPGVNHGAPISFSLVLFRGNRRAHTFRTGQIMWSWHFVDHGRRVAYCSGPTHGAGGECVLRDVASGGVVERWVDEEGQTPKPKPQPIWVNGLWW
jgi:hypothetical protein